MTLAAQQIADGWKAQAEAVLKKGEAQRVGRTRATTKLKAL